MIDVLVVDDDKLVRKGLISAMPWSEFGMRVAGEASDGEKALAFLESRPVHLLVTDLAMPGMNGLELMRAARKRYPDMHIAVLTLHQDFEYIQEALRLGAIDFIVKAQLDQERFEEVLGRIHERILQENMKRSAAPGDAAADGLSTARFYAFAAAAPAAGAADSPEREEEALARLKARWLSSDWTEPERLAALMAETVRLRLPAARINRLLHEIAVEWNRFYGELLQSAIELPPVFDSWEAAEAWLLRVCDSARLLRGAEYSREVAASVMAAVRIVKEELHEQLYAIDVARRVNMSRSYFNQCFKDIVGLSFNEYLRKARIDRAKEYLLQSRKPVQWIAERTGYTDVKYFSRTFREMTGELPSEYRKSRTGDK